MLAAVRNEPQKAPARMLILEIFIKMDGKLLDPARQKRDLNLWRAGVSVVKAGLGGFVLFLALRKHSLMVSHYVA